jgi:hypothetical protein
VSPDDASGLPTVLPDGDLARVRCPWTWTSLCFGLTLFLYVALVPPHYLYSSPPTGAQPHYLMVLTSILEDDDLDVANNYAPHSTLPLAGRSRSSLRALRMGPDGLLYVQDGGQIIVYDIQR